MQRDIKAALMLLYAAQLGIAFQHSLAYLYEDATRGLHAYLTYAHSNAGLSVAAKTASAHDIAADLASHAIASEHPIHGPEDIEEKQKHDRTRATRRQRSREIVYRNVWADIMRFAAPENGERVRAVPAQPSFIPV